MNGVPRLLWLDCCGGLLVGVAVLAASRWIAVWHNLPTQLIVATGLANLVYGCYSLFLATRKTRSLYMICALAIANMIWAPICFALTIGWWNDISLLGFFHLIGEGVYVGGLGVVEWLNRNTLSTDS